MHKFDVELIETVSYKMKRGKAASLDELTVEHVVYSYPVLAVILSRLFNVIMSVGHVPYGFRLSYTVTYQRKILLVRGTSLIIIQLYQSAQFYRKCSSIVFCQYTVNV